MHRERLIKSATPLEFLSIKLTVYVKRGLDHFFHVYKVVGTSWFLLRNGILYSNTSMEAAAFMIIRDHRLLSGSKTSNTSKYYFYCVFYTHGNKINFFSSHFLWKETHRWMHKGNNQYTVLFGFYIGSCKFWSYFLSKQIESSVFTQLTLRVRPSSVFGKRCKFFLKNWSTKVILWKATMSLSS